MPKVIYISPDETEHEINVPVGMTIMHGALLNNIPGLLAECGGAMICATCHCYIDSAWLNSVDIASSGEREKLAKVHNPKPNSRLSCQLRVTEELEGIRVYLPESQVWSR